MLSEGQKLAELRLSVQRGLWANVTSNLACVRAEIAGEWIHIYAYFFVEPTDDDREYVECAATEVIADYPAPYKIETHFALIPEPPFQMPGLVFLRAEADIPRTKRSDSVPFDVG